MKQEDAFKILKENLDILKKALIFSRDEIFHFNKYL